MILPPKASARSEKRDSSARVHRDFAKSRSRPVKTVPSNFSNEESTLNMTKAMIRKMLDRKERLRSDPWISKDGEFGPIRVQCAACDQLIGLDPRQQYYCTPWYKHVFRCVPIRAHYFNKGQHMPYEALVCSIHVPHLIQY